MLESIAYFILLIILSTTFPHSSFLVLNCCFRRNSVIKKRNNSNEIAQSTFDSLLLQAKEHFENKNYKEAITCYKQALSLNPNAVDVRLDLIDVLLEDEYFFEATQEAQKIIDDKGNTEKALYRLGKAAYGMQDWEKAIKCFEQVFDEKAQEELSRSKMRLLESITGIYDWKNGRDLKNPHLTKYGICDVADYIGPVKVVDIPGKGKGTIVTKDVDKGTCLLALKAYVIDFQTFSPKKFIEMTIEKLRKNPHTIKEFYSLYAGQEFGRDEKMPADGEIDKERIKVICSLNNFGGNLHFHDKSNWQGLWIGASFFNHSCIPNCHNSAEGDIMTIMALTDLKQGDELTITYCFPFMSYEERQKRLKTWGFECQCRLCELDRADPEIGRREELLKECRQLKTLIKKEPQKWLETVTRLLENMKKTYAKRHELRLDLFKVLLLMQNLQILLGNYENAVKINEEIGETLGEPYKYYDEKPFNALYWIMHLLEPESAKKVAKESLELRRIRVGSSREMFESDCPRFAKFLE